MELKYGIIFVYATEDVGSNCTFMELKFGTGCAVLFDELVLIVPLWN